MARTTADGAPVALTHQRASRGREVLAALGFRKLNRGEVDDAGDLPAALDAVPFSMNWAYVNADDIAYFHSGHFPVRAQGASADLPTWGTGAWEWQGFLDHTDHAQVVNPDKGYFESWNNKVAPGWTPADSHWGAGEVQRVDLIDRRVQAHAGDFGVADAVSVVQDASTADLRGELIVPEVLAVLDGTPAPRPQLETVREVLADWAAAGANRRDRDRDWFYDDPAVPIVDALFDPVVHAIFDAKLAGLYDALFPSGFDGGANPGGSSFGSGWYSYVFRDLRRVRGLDAGDLEAPVVCGGGDLDACRDALWDALGTAWARARAEQLPWNAPNIRDWTKWTGTERIFFEPFLAQGKSLRWQNRATFQQVMSFTE